MTRERLPPRRGCATFKFDHKSASGAILHYTCGFGRFDSGRVAEVFLQNRKAGSDSDSNAREAATMYSIALQFGAPIDVLRKAALRNADNTASTPLGHVLDLIAAEHKP